MEAGAYWMVFFSAALAINLSPGPDLVHIVSNTVARGRRVGVASSLGVCTGALVHVLATAFGVSTIIATSAAAFTVVKFAGAAYLTWLGIGHLRSKGTAFDAPTPEAVRTTPWGAFKQGALVDILNPKVAVFFMAFLPQFVRPELGNPTGQLLLLGVLVILVAVVVEFGVVLVAARATALFRRNRRASVWLDRLLGSVLLGLGVRLALTESA
ncbi:LysE family translocator [Deferrisoma camini]|uniref:LysE family translocator n=1 Tax=Deferrisoma camini TaxID=1035120 RepID=UPI00046CEDA0|nr:LysE family translocator [Deferrisoma camini]